MLKKWEKMKITWEKSHTKKKILKIQCTPYFSSWYVSILFNFTYVVPHSILAQLDGSM